MEGDHHALGRLHNTVVLDGQPSVPELLSILRQQSLSVVLDVSALEPRGRLEYLSKLPPVIEAERAAWGLPHWIVIDEAHVTLAEGGIASDVFRPADRGYCLVTYHPEWLSTAAVAAVDVTITATPPTILPGDPSAHATATATLRETGSPARPFTVHLRRTPHVRHRGKYAVAILPERQWFRFRGPDGHVVATAATVADFSHIVRDIDSTVVAHHTKHGDFSRWILGTIQDRDLAAAVAAIEHNILARQAADLLHARERLFDEVDSRYLT